MKKTKFIVFGVAVLFCLAALAWLPDSKNFDPAFFTTNNFKISLKVDSILTGSNAFVTNITVISRTDDTNSVVVYTVGDVASRGIYYFRDTLNAIHRYTNSSANGRMVAYDPDELDFGFDFPFAITNGIGGILYGANSGQSFAQPSILPKNFVRQSPLGTLPSGIITWGTNVTTNTMLVIASTIPAVIDSTGSNTWYVEAWGNDLFAQRGKPKMPSRNLYRVFTNAVEGDNVMVGPGHFTNDFSDSASQLLLLEFPPSFTVTGSGQGVTFMDGVANSSKWHLANSNTISHFTATNVLFYDGFHVATNIQIHDITAGALGDVIVFIAGTMHARIWNCNLLGNSDKIADLCSFPAYLTNSILTVENCHIGGGPGAADGIPDGLNASGLMTWRGGGIHVDVDGASFEEHILTNGVAGKPGFKGPGSFIFAPQILKTNWIGGQLYTNMSSGVWEIKVTSILTFGNVAGAAVQQLWVYNLNMLGGGLGTTNIHARQTTTSTENNTTNSVTLSAWIPPGFVFAITNQSGGGGANSAKNQDGQLFIP